VLATLAGCLVACVAPQRTIEARPSAAYAIASNGAVVRLDGEALVPLRALPGREPGRARALASDAAGTLYVAAAGGVFIAAPDCDVLDRVDFDGAAPRGEPVGVAVADSERLWLLTSTQLYAVETRQFLCSELDVGLPAPPYSALIERGSGRFEIAHAGGAHVVELGELPAIAWGEARALNPRRRADGVIELEFGAPLELALEARDDLRWMWRDATRFRWLPLEGERARIEFTRPGRQSVHVIAFDRALRRSPQRVFEVDVAYPEALETDALALLVGIPALAVIAVGAALAWRRDRSVRALWKGFLGAALFCVVALQLCAAAVPHSKGWPFLGFSMYTRLSFRDSLSYRHEFLGLAPDGSWHPLAPPGGAYGKYENERALQPFIHDTDGRRARFLAEWNAAHPSARLIGIADLCRRRRMTPAGPVDVPRQVMFVHPGEAARALR
jgi:hypothetical protein